MFYNKLIIAESNRAVLQIYSDSKNWDKNDLSGRYFDRYMDMRFNIIEAFNMIEDLLIDLSKESGENLNENIEIKELPSIDWKSMVNPEQT